ncbi:esterase-like activity of phytase family protein [Polymorphum gilvum]|uniref:Twin-arginine translocation pathway signal n=1 Tax=Polymorphum gilvum (strain LMG 25793 / CGMCC 1.9160 / SL003B-26A1) TaxID=991905 RepID=F2J216_POLGS|nr:esterase-like activity of phytase family protein [Polymorphum gilvum]ADZ68775.1 Twin-arginine translocation pathway signal [Polymorphum gilvum SL003B-26A1]
MSAPGRARKVLALVGLLLAAGPVAAPAQELLSDAKPVTAAIRPIERFATGSDAIRFGALTYLGGLEIAAANRDIGGLSGLVSLDSGTRLLAATDNGLWVAATVEQDADGTPLSLRDMRYAPMIDEAGRRLRDGWANDTEALTLGTEAGRPVLYVSVERVNRIYRYPWPLASGTEPMLGDVATPDGIRDLRGTKGMEALAAAPEDSPLAGALIAIAERGASDSHDLPGFILGGPTPGSFTVARSDRYDATDAAFLPDGDLLLLERRFNLRDWVGMRLRRFAATEIRPGARLVGTVVMEAGHGHQIDNMEGLAVHQDAEGRTVLTLISDDNRSILQRTLLLRFRLEQ